MPTNPEHEKGGQYADAKQKTPRYRLWQNGIQTGINKRRYARTNGRTGLHKTDAATAIFVANHFAHQHRTGRPLAAEAEPVQCPQYE